MNNIIIGYSGFVGSNLLQFYKFDELYNSSNFINAKNKNFNTIYFCGIPAVKWYANKNPEIDDKVINNIIDILNTITCNKFILISTIDVYEETDKLLDEDYICNYNNNHTYGKNRYIFEKYIEKQFLDHHIIRLPALFGKGLKKNIIYDLLNNNSIPLNTSFQWYNLDWLKKDIDIIIGNKIKLCNLFTEPFETNEILKIFENIYKKKYIVDTNNKRIEYNTCTKYSKLFGNDNCYIRSKDLVIDDIKEFLIFTNINKDNLCVSNICINSISQLQFACLLKLYGIKRIQLAPTKLINNWNNLNNMDLSIFNGIVDVYSYQSIAYNLNNLNIFDKNTSEEFYNHLIKIIDSAENNNVKIIVFGCPRNRYILDNKLDNNTIFINFFKKIGDYCLNKKVIICIENNSKGYNCNFINTIKDCEYIVRNINKPNIKMMVDFGNAIMENDNYKDLPFDIIYNIDISNEKMKDLSILTEEHKSFKNILNKNILNINLEFLINNYQNELIILNNSIKNFIKIFN
jgi:sugar phosphate isomerase/epimerase